MNIKVNGAAAGIVIFLCVVVIAAVAYRMFAKPAVNAEEIKASRARGMANQHYQVDPARAALRGGYRGPQMPVRMPHRH